MAFLTLPIDPAGYLVEVLIGLNGRATLALVSTGKPVLPPVRATAILDSGSNVTCVAGTVLQQLGLSSIQSATTQTVAGSHPVRLFQVSLSVLGPAGLMFTLEDLTVIELVSPNEDADVLLGRDVLAHGVLIIHGPGKNFTLTF